MISAIAPTSSLNLRIRIFLPVFGLACVAGLWWVFARPAVYASSARVQVEVPADPAQAEPGVQNRSLLNATQALTSSAVLDQVVAKFAGAMAVDVDRLRSMMSATPLPGTNIIELRTEGAQPGVLPVILTAWIDAYRRTQVDAFQSASGAAIADAKANLQQLKDDVAAKRQELDQFRRKHGIVSLDRVDHQAAARMKSLNDAMNDARNREADAEARLNAMRENVEAGKAAQGVTERPIVLELETRAADLRQKMRDAEQDYTAQYLALDPKYKALRLNLTRLERQLEQERKLSTRQALLKIEGELSGARLAVARLQREMSSRKQEAQEFTARFSEYSALTDELNRLVEAHDGAKVQMGELEKAARKAGPRLSVLDQPLAPERPARPDYWRDAVIAVLGAGLLGMLAVWFVEFLRRPSAQRPEPVVAQPIINIAFPAGLLRGGADVAALGPAETRLLSATAMRLPEPASFPRELSIPETRALWSAAVPDAQVVIAGLLGGLTLEEVGALRYEHIDPEASSARLADAAGRSCKLRDPLRRLVIERRTRNRVGPVVADAGGNPLSDADLEGLIACAAVDAGLTDAADVGSAVLRHTYFAYLIRQGARMAEIGEFIGRLPPAAFREYGRLSPPGPGLPLEDIDPVFPALR